LYKVYDKYDEHAPARVNVSEAREDFAELASAADHLAESAVSHRGSRIQLVPRMRN
jgi:hypothetical protein